MPETSAQAPRMTGDQLRLQAQRSSDRLMMAGALATACLSIVTIGLLAGLAGFSPWVLSNPVTLGLAGAALIGVAASILAAVFYRRLVRANLEMRTSLERASASKSAFLAHMSHELRTPMTGVLGLADLLSRTKLDETQQDAVKGLKSAGESMVLIINDILDLSKIEAGMMTIESIDFRPGKVLADVATLYGPIAERQSLDLSVDLEQAFDKTFRGDPVRFFQIVSNLVSNALKFTERGGVEIQGRLIINPNGQLLRISVTDTGMGMDEPTLRKIFDPFAQADETVARKFGGTGLGLSICRNLATLCGGNLIATSEPDVGTTFILTLPAREPHRELPTEDGAASDDAYCKAPIPPGLKVLVADDVATNRMVIQAMLRRYEADVRLMDSGDAALEAFRKDPFDLVLTDIQMPGLSGVELCREIRAFEAAEGRDRTPVFAITANIFEHQAIAYREAGFDGLVQKPFVLADLESALVSAAPQTGSGDVELF